MSSFKRSVFDLPAETHARLVELATAEGRTMKAVVTRLIDDEHSRIQQPAPKRSRPKKKAKTTKRKTKRRGR